MKTKLLSALILFVFAPLCFSQTIGFNSSFGVSPYGPSFSVGVYTQPPIQQHPPVSGDFSAWQECNAKIQGGADGFPWSVAKPFPWADIQGVWKLRDGALPYYLKAKVIRTTSNRKILSLSVISVGSCSRPIAQGLGYVDFSERNVVRAIMNDGISKYQMKVASFDVRDLEIDSSSCGDNVVVALIQPIGSIRNHRGLLHGSETEGGSENIMLEKTTEDVATICRKLDR